MPLLWISNILLHLHTCINIKGLSIPFESDVAYIEIIKTLFPILPADLSMPYPIATATGNWHLFQCHSWVNSFHPYSSKRKSSIFPSKMQQKKKVSLILAFQMIWFFFLMVVWKFLSQSRIFWSNSIICQVFRFWLWWPWTEQNNFFILPDIPHHVHLEAGAG